MGFYAKKTITGAYKETDQSDAEAKYYIQTKEEIEEIHNDLLELSILKVRYNDSLTQKLTQEKSLLQKQYESRLSAVQARAQSAEGKLDAEVRQNLQLNNAYQTLKRSNQELDEKYKRVRERIEELESYEYLEDGMVQIPEKDYNGYQKMLRVIRDRSLQQIDKNKADEHGYTLLNAKKREFTKYRDAWLVRKRTPYSLKMNLDEASFMIKKDLKQFYFMKNEEVASYDDSMIFETAGYYDELDGEDIPKDWKMKDWVHIIYSWMQKHGHNGVILKIDEFATNIGAGCYEVVYWSTKPL